MSDFFDSLTGVMIPLCAGSSGRTKQRAIECRVIVSRSAGYVGDACLVTVEGSNGQHFSGLAMCVWKFGEKIV